MNPAVFLNQRRQLLNTGFVSPSEVKEIVALDLMTKIAQAEAATVKKQTESPREYYLTLYSQSLRTVSGEDIEDILGVEL